MASVATADFLSIADGKLRVSGNCSLADIHENISLTPPAKNKQGAFIGVMSDQRGGRLVLPVGKLKGLILCLYRFKLWWMTQWMGTCGQDIPCETQFLIVEVPNISQFGEETEDEEEEQSNSVYYIVFLPIIDGDFRAVLQGNAHDEICLESGDPSVQECEGRHLVYVAAGNDPYSVIKNSVCRNPYADILPS